MMFFNDLSLLGRSRPLFARDLDAAEAQLQKFFTGARVLVAGGAGSIGQEVVKLLAGFPLAALSVVDASENNLVELTRDFRSSVGYIEGETKFLPLDILSVEFDAFLKAEKPFDVVLNFSAMKHVRSEKDPWSLMRMIEINIFAAKKLLDYAAGVGAKKYFCVSTDKAQNPVSLMGASKRIMEGFLSQGEIAVSTARFANVAFSDGSLLHGFQKRLEKRQPLSTPSDVRRYFMTGEEAGILCLLSIALGEGGEIFFPVLDEEKETASFSDIALKYLKKQGYEAFLCESEDAARAAVKTAPEKGRWPLHVFKSDTTGEKYLEEFFGAGDKVNRARFGDVAVIEGLPRIEKNILEKFEADIKALKNSGAWAKGDVVKIIEAALPGYRHAEKGKSLDERM